MIEYNHMLAEKAMELANLALAGIVFVQLVPGMSMNERKLILGGGAFLVLHAFAYIIMKRR